MKKRSRIVWGVVLVVLGLLFAADAIGIMNINYALFFSSWWTLLIIVPFAVSLITKGPRVINIIGLFVGIALLLGSRGILPYETVSRLIFPAVVIIIGVFMIFGRSGKKAERKIGEKIEQLRKDTDTQDIKEYTAVFSGQDLSFNGETLTNLNLDAVFGGVKCDLRGAVLDKDIVINATAVFGGVEITAPEGICVKVKSTSIFGGVTNHVNSSDNTGSPVIYVNGSGIFGGVTVK